MPRDDTVAMYIGVEPREVAPEDWLILDQNSMDIRTMGLYNR